jgi:antitoxin (DNA-binding transcriptional repressor) of toxin-antitoxin stability system
MYTLDMQEMNVSEFRRKCLALMDNLPADGILITKHGHPVAKLTPVRRSCADLIGSVPGMVIDPNDDLFSTGIEWDAES